MPDANEWVIAYHEWALDDQKLPRSMKCKYVTYSDGTGGFFDNMEDEIWQPEEVNYWVPLATSSN